VAVTVQRDNMREQPKPGQCQTDVSKLQPDMCRSDDEIEMVLVVNANERTCPQLGCSTDIFVLEIIDVGFPCAHDNRSTLDKCRASAVTISHE